MHKKILLHTVLALCAALGASVAQAEDDYPSRPVRFVIPFPPGGTLDMLGRDVAQKLSEQTGQSFVVENRSGGNGIIGADVVAKSRADGYTLLFNASTFTTAPMTMKSVPFDVDKNFVPVAMAGKAPLSVSVKKDLPVTDLAGLLAYAKQNPGRLTFAVGSVGSAGHLATELLKRQGGLDYMVIPYRGTAPALQDLVGGRIDGFIDPVLGAVSYYKSGMVKMLAVTSDTRLPNLPEVPTVGETLPGLSVLQLVRPVGASRDARGDRREAEHRGQQGLVLGDQGQVRATRDSDYTGLGCRIRPLSEGRYGAVTQDRGRRPHPCRLMQEGWRWSPAPPGALARPSCNACWTRVGA
jgi:tripartite-type tricarboxylate transporter receptor subunit TctC